MRYLLLPPSPNINAPEITKKNVPVESAVKQCYLLRNIAETRVEKRYCTFYNQQIKPVFQQLQKEASLLFFSI